jgi:hypothetical protein
VSRSPARRSLRAAAGVAVEVAGPCPARMSRVTVPESRSPERTKSGLLGQPNDWDPAPGYWRRSLYQRRLRLRSDSEGRLLESGPSRMTVHRDHGPKYSTRHSSPRFLSHSLETSMEQGEDFSYERERSQLPGCVIMKLKRRRIISFSCASCMLKVPQISRACTVHLLDGIRLGRW